MAEEVKKYIASRVKGSAVNTDPFPFLYVQNFFPKSYYEHLAAIFPDSHQLTNILDKKFSPVISMGPGTDVTVRSTLTIYNRYVGYEEIEKYQHSMQCIKFRLLVNKFLIPLIADKLQYRLPDKWDDDTRFVLDQKGYGKQPHTDHPKKLLSILIYMSNSICSTNILRPKQLGFSDESNLNHDFADFNVVFKPPFVPNSILAFARTNTSFHSVDWLRVDENRKAIHITVTQQ